MNRPLGAAATRELVTERAVGPIRGEDRDDTFDVVLGHVHRVSGKQLLEFQQVVIC
jgi:hypothetical protein